MNLSVYDIDDGVDAVFLPGKIHGCEDEVYVIYYNSQANDGNGSWEIEIVDKPRILSLYEAVHGNADLFFECLSDLFQGEWRYCDAGSEMFEKYRKVYADADFLFGRDGDAHDEMLFLINWARNTPNERKYK